MDDKEVKAAAAAARPADENDVKPGAIQIGGVETQRSSQSNRNHTVDIDNNPLIRKVLGERPNHAENRTVTDRNMQDNNHNEQIATISTSAVAMMTPRDVQQRPNECVTSTNTYAVEAIDDSNSNRLIRKLRGEIPSCWGNGGTDEEMQNVQHDVQSAAAKIVDGRKAKTAEASSALATINTNVTQVDPSSSQINDDLERSVNDKLGTNNELVIALPVDEYDTNTPTAVEFDLDAKPSVSNMNIRLGSYIFLAFVTIIIGIAGTSIGIKMTSTPTKTLNSTPNAFRERVAQTVSIEQLDDISNPYRKALDWISTNDPMVTTPDNPRFVQRYILAYLYFTTSIKQPWVSDCAPSDDIDKFNCVYALKIDEERVTSKSAFKWLSNTDECKWAGIHCDLKSQIDRIELGGIGMSGTFPDGVVHLPYLNDISLMYGELEGPLPELMGGFKNLRSINLRSNKFTGTIPSEWLQSRSLQNIILESNRITGTISSSISQLYDLNVVNLNGNSLMGTIPSEISGLRNLHFILFEGNNVHGSIPTELGQLTNLWSFSASSNLMTGTIPMQIGDMDNIQDFYVSDNLLTGEIPESFWKATNLYTIQMADNFLTGTISGKITTLSNLDKLIISNNQFTGALPARLGQTSIATIKASGNMFNGTIAPQLCDLVEKGQLEILEMDCAAPANAGINTSITAEIICPTDCCTLCCTPDGKTCHPN